MNLESQTFWVVTFACVLCIYGAFMVFSRWSVNSPAVPAKKLGRLRVGMSKPEVMELLGKPRRERNHHTGVQWSYGHRLKRHQLVVQFNEAGRLAQFQHVFEAESDHQQTL